jgi:hypothetical protein
MPWVDPTPHKKGTILSNYPTGYAQPSPTPPPQPRKRRTWLIVLIVILVISGLGFAACVAAVGSIGQAMNESAASGEPYEQMSEPREVTPGKEFTIGSHKTLAGWKVVKEDNLGEGMFNAQGKVTNVSDIDRVPPLQDHQQQHRGDRQRRVQLW